MTPVPPREVLTDGCLRLERLGLARLRAPLLPASFDLFLVPLVPAASRRSHTDIIRHNVGGKPTTSKSPSTSSVDPWPRPRQAASRTVGSGVRHAESLAGGAARRASPNGVSPSRPGASSDMTSRYRWATRTFRESPLRIPYTSPVTGPVLPGPPQMSKCRRMVARRSVASSSPTWSSSSSPSAEMKAVSGRPRKP